MDKSRVIICRKCGMPLKRGTKVCSYCQCRASLITRKAPKPKNRKGIHIGHYVIPIPWISLLIILMNIIAGLYKVSGEEYVILSKYGMVREALQKGEYLRLIASGFLHLSPLHLLSNMYALVIYGFLFENRIGHFRYLIIYIVSLLSASLLINFFGGSGIHVGASGAIWGLMTANLVYCLKTRSKFLYLIYALFAVAGNVVYTFAFGVSWQAHLGGAIAGILLGLILFAREGKTKD